MSAFAAPAEQAKAIPHPTEGRENCRAATRPEAAAQGGTPADHEGRTSETCLMCHGSERRARRRAGAGASKTAEGGTAPAAAPAGEAATSAAGAEPGGDQRWLPDLPQQAGVRHRLRRPEPNRHRRSSWSRPVVRPPLHRLHHLPQRRPAPEMAPITKSSIAEACGTCHESQRLEHETSIHGESLSSGGKDAASCVDCHSTQDTPHSIARVLSPDSPAYRASVAATCAKCHAKEDVMERYGVPTEVYKTYMGTFHGKANVLSPYEITQHPKATCVNCHGYHDIKAENGTRASPVNPANLSATCGSCHPGAGERSSPAGGWGTRRPRRSSSRWCTSPSGSSSSLPAPC